MKVMQEVTGRKTYTREPSTQRLDTYLANRGTLRPRPVTARQLEGVAAVKAENKSPAKTKDADKEAKGRSVSFVIPEGPQLPTPGLNYESFSMNQLKELTELLTQLVFERIKM